MRIDDNKKLTASVEPADADTDSLLWESFDTSVAQVRNGNLTAVGEGTATISVVSENRKRAECAVTVYEMIAETLDIFLQEQPLYVSSTKYLVQSEQYI